MGRKLRTEATGKRPTKAWQDAATEARMHEIVGAWTPEQRRWARRSLMIDYVFLASYGLLMSLVCTEAAMYFRHRAVPGVVVFAIASWAAILAAALDLRENLFLRKTLEPFTGDHLPSRMFRVSRMKGRLTGVVGPIAVVGLSMTICVCR